jgi:hypothetical protein
VRVHQTYPTEDEVDRPSEWKPGAGADARFAVTIGFLLYLLMPTDLVATATVGAYIARQGEPWWHTLGFVVLTVLIAGLPFIVLLAMGKRAQRAPEDPGVDECELLDRQRGRAPLFPGDGAVLVSEGVSSLRRYRQDTQISTTRLSAERR